ncbi:MAG: thermosome subunit alpha [Thermosphaera sp.]
MSNSQSYAGLRKDGNLEIMLSNIRVCKILADLVKTSLGPLGMKKLILMDLNDLVATSDGGTILRWLDMMEISPPVVKMMIEATRAQEIEFGDGCISTVLLIGEFLSKAEELIKLGIHPAIIIDGYKKALSKAIKLIREKLSIQISLSQHEILRNIIKTAIKQSQADDAEWLSKVLLDAVIKAMSINDCKFDLDLDRVKIINVKGGYLRDSCIIHGVVLEKKGLDPNMPKKIENARIILLNTPIALNQAKFIERNFKALLTSPQHVQQMMIQRRRILENIAEKIIATGANVIISSQNIDDIVLGYFARNNAMAIRWAGKFDLRKISYATGAKIISNPEEVTANDLGFAESVEEVKFGDDKMIIVRCGDNSKVISIVVRGAGRIIAEEAEKSIKKGLYAARSVIRDTRIVYGGGAIEIDLAIGLEDYAYSIKSKEQIVVQKFAEALEEIPVQLARSTGLDPITTLAELKALHQEGRRTFGVDVLNARIADMRNAGVFEPASIKENIIKTSVEAALMILRIDDVFVTKKKFGKKCEDKEVLEEMHKEARELELRLGKELRRDYEKVAIDDTWRWLPKRY